MKRMYRITVVLFFGFLSAISLHAQQKLSGVIRDAATQQPVADVYVMLMSDDGKNILAYSFSAENGSYAINIPPNSQAAFLVSTSRLGYETFTQEISRSHTHLDISLKESSIPLREVKITSKPIKQRGDTIDYYISSFVRPQDKNLADVLARMPGIEVQTDGRVQYEGKPINRFYIENMNLLEQRYSIATKNLSPDDIATVQVYENHEPVKMLRDRSSSEQAALNIKLKEDARAKWLNTIDFGVGGFPFLYNATGTLARFARSNQSMMVGKANNTGKDIFLELKMHTLKPGQGFRPGLPDGIPDQLLPLSVASSFFTRDRARFNESAIASLNQLWRVAEDTDLRLNINYGFEREKRERNAETEYRFEHQPSIIITNHASQTINWHKMENELALTANKSSFYLEEKLNANIHWKDAVADVITNSYHIGQQMRLPRFHFKNNTALKKMLNRWSLSAENNSEFTRLPQSLAVSSSENLPLFAQQSVRQMVVFHDGYTDNFLSLSRKKRYATFGLKTGIEWVWQNLTSELLPVPQLTGDAFGNDQSWRSTRLYAEPSYRIQYRKADITLSVSANGMRTDFNDVRQNYTYINPRLRTVYEPNGSLKLTAGYSRNIRYGNLNQLQTGYVMKSYNSFAKGMEELQRTTSQNVNWGVFYKNISQFFNINYMGSYSIFENNAVSATFIRDIYHFAWRESSDNRSRFWMNNLSATKLFADISLTAGLGVSYNCNASIMRQQNAEMDYTNHTFGISPSMKWNAQNRLNFDYSMSAYFSAVSINGKPVKEYIPFVSHQLFTFWGITDKLSVTNNLQHFYNKSPNQPSTNLLFADLGVQYTFRKVIVNLDWTNIFNQKRHITSSYNTVNTTTRVDKLRPMEILVSFRFKR